MEIIVVDTDVIISYSKGLSPELIDLLIRQEKKEVILYVSAVTLYEFYSANSFSHLKNIKIADEIFNKFKIINLHKEIAKIAAKINRERKLQQKIGVSDTLIAATCLYLEAKLLTKNKKHFKSIPGLSFA